MKSRRHFAIMDIIARYPVSTQEELCEALRENGFDVTQATVSRDIKEMHLIKVPSPEGYRYAVPEVSKVRSSQDRMKRLFQDSVVRIDYSNNIIVIKTLPGAAQSIASVIDNSEQEEILGTVAGDDTIFIVVKPPEDVEKVTGDFIRLLNE